MQFTTAKPGLDGRTDILFNGQPVGYVYRTGSREWVAKLYGDKRFWKFATKHDAVAEVKIQAS